jgi:exodeoxyribonuclease VII small subunit
MAEKKFEEAMQRLEEIVESLEDSDLSLNDSLKIFEEGVKLIGFCSKRLEEVEQKVTMLVKENEGKYTQQPFEVGVQEED